MQTHPNIKTFKTQHTLGAKGYELTNHLGNVQVVVTDKKFEQDLDDDDTIDVYAPSLTAAYDYYPFGMLMPGRYTSDTAQHCTWVTQTKLIQTEQVFEPWPGWNCGICGFFKLSNNSNVNVEDPGGSEAMLVIETDDTSGYVGGAAVDVDVTPGKEMQVNVPVALINGGNFIMTVSETDTATVELASTELSQAGEVFTLSFTPTQSSVQFKVINTQPGAGMIGLGEVDFAVLMPQAVNVLVRVCDESEDWRNKFNGMEADDEIKGRGNSLDFGARMYSSRLGIFLSLDPLFKKFPWQSSYLFAANNPIMYLDKEGKEHTHFTVLITDKATTVIKKVTKGNFHTFNYSDGNEWSEIHNYSTTMTIDARKGVRSEDRFTVSGPTAYGPRKWWTNVVAEKASNYAPELPQVMVFGSGNDYNDWLKNPNAEAGKKTYTIDMKELNEIFGIINTAFISSPDFNSKRGIESFETAVEKSVELVNEKAQDKINESGEGTGYCKDCGGSFLNGKPTNPSKEINKDTISLDQHKH